MFWVLFQPSGNLEPMKLSPCHGSEQIESSKIPSVGIKIESEQKVLPLHVPKIETQILQSLPMPSEDLMINSETLDAKPMPMEELEDVSESSEPPQVKAEVLTDDGIPNEPQIIDAGQPFEIPSRDEEHYPHLQIEVSICTFAAICCSLLLFVVSRNDGSQPLSSSRS